MKLLRHRFLVGKERTRFSEGSVRSGRREAKSWCKKEHVGRGTPGWGTMRPHYGGVNISTDSRLGTHVEETSFVPTGKRTGGPEIGHLPNEIEDLRRSAGSSVIIVNAYRWRRRKKDNETRRQWFPRRGRSFLFHEETRNQENVYQEQGNSDIFLLVNCQSMYNK